MRWNDLAGIYGISVDMDTDMNNLLKLAKLYPAEYKEVRDYMINGMSYIPTDRHSKILRIFHKYIDIFGKDHFITHTLYKVLGESQKSWEQVNKEYANSNSLPPAFDQSLIAHGIYEDLIEDILLEKNHMMDDILDDWRLRLRKELHKAKPALITLNNGTATRIQSIAGNVNDILGITYMASDIDYEVDCREIRKFFKILNWNKEFDYLEYNNNSVFGRLLVIPDKDGKTRQIYNLDPPVQVISKGIARIMDRFVRPIDGNYTTAQMKWGQNMLQQGWNRSKLIVSTDMSKYSDTLSRRMMMMLLNRLGIPVEVTYEMDRLFSLPVIDPTGRVLSNTLATYQGQYADFALITLCNLFCAYLTYRMLGEIRGEGYSGAVGDDTVMVFDNVSEDKARSMIQSVYNSMGVQINQSKTHVLNRGEGHIDFCKRIYNSEGIISYLNPKAINSKFSDDKFDEVRRLTDEGFQDERVYYLILGDDYNKFKNLHKLNGGLRDGVITREDIKLFVKKARQLSIEQFKSVDTTMRVLDYIDSEIPIENTELIGWSKYGVEWLTNDDNEILVSNLRDDIRQNIIHDLQYGYSTELTDLESIIGMTLQQIEEQKPDLYESLQENITTLSYRDKRKRRDNKVYETILNTNIDIEDINEVNRILICEDRTKGVVDIMLTYIKQYCDKIGGRFYINHEFGHNRVTVIINDEEYRLYHVETSSKLDPIPSGIIKEALEYKLGKLSNDEFSKLFSFFWSNCGDCYSNYNNLRRLGLIMN